ncbi:EAL domain-containing protein [Pseudomonas sp. LFM046]|uniref:EAL domain-containing protein n=1 Tax=Pseudomonas sp. LFM046 TaxID=1608357 RepID=UPI0005CFB443|nr:EAL domain-containing protein [Pseudomonas sp. LFM046]
MVKGQGWHSFRWAEHLLFSVVVLIAIGLALLASSFTAHRLLDQSVGGLGEDVVRQIDVVLDASERTLAEMDASPHAVCSGEDFTVMRSALVRAKYIKDVGRLADDRLVCSTVLGILPTPFTAVQVPISLAPNMAAFWTVPLLSSSDAYGLVLQSRRSNLMMDLDAFRVPVAPGLHYVIALRDRPKALVIGLDPLGLPAFIEAGHVADLSGGQAFCSSRYPLCSTVVATAQARSIAERNAMYLLILAGGILGCCAGAFAVIAYRRRVSLSAQMRRALANGLFAVRYQPIMELGPSPRMVSAEALIRWIDGPVPPDVFIGVAERCDLITEITAFVVRTVLSDMRQLFEAQPDFRVTINVSSPELVDGSLLATLDRCWPEGLPRRHVGFELTERSTAELQDIMVALQRLHDLGHPIYVDDFGTGYSSLSQLQHLPIDYIKVDRSLLPSEPRSRNNSFVPEILAIARRLGVGLVFEGVETEEQAQLLNCTGQTVLAQGWFFGRPDTAEALLRLGSAVHPAELQCQE